MARPRPFSFVRLSVLGLSLALVFSLAPTSEADDLDLSPRQQKTLSRLIEEGGSSLQELQPRAAVKAFRKADRLADGRSFDAALGLAAALHIVATPDTEREALEVARRLVDIANGPEQRAFAYELVGQFLYEQTHYAEFSAHNDSDVERRIALFAQATQPLETAIALSPSAARHARAAFALMQQVLLVRGSGSEDLERRALEHLDRAEALGMPEVFADLAAHARCFAEWSDADEPEIADDAVSSIRAPRKVWAPHPSYPEAALYARLEKTIRVRAIIDRLGETTCIWPVVGGPLGLDTATLHAVDGWHFKPALHDEEPISVWYDLEVHFALRRGR